VRHALLLLSFAVSLAACGGAQSGGGGDQPLVAVGEPAPQFMLQDQTGRVRQLSEYRGQPVVLYFYPRDATPGCTAEACAFRDAWDRLSAAGAVVLGVSTDDVASHQRFHDEHHLPFDLLADIDGTVARQYGVPVRMGVAMRITFLLDGEGTVRRVYEDVDPGVHADEVISAIQALTPAPAAAAP
jgi:peroxiredoxin Q/BCP